MRRRLLCADEESLRRFFAELGDFEAVVEATASYDGFVRLPEPLARRVVRRIPRSCG